MPLCFSHSRYFPGIGFTDGYVIHADGKRVAYEFLGCHFHAHKNSSCPYTLGKNWEEKSCHKMSLNEKHEKTSCRIIALANHPSVDEVWIKYQCDWEREIKEESSVREFVENMLPHPMKRLIPRVSMSI